jgi:hypothetical protein
MHELMPTGRETRDGDGWGVGSGHEALEAGKAKASWVNTCKANMDCGKTPGRSRHFSSWDCIPVPIKECDGSKWRTREYAHRNVRRGGSRGSAT